MTDVRINVFLADDDEDDCLLFRQALQEIPLPSFLQTINNGEQLLLTLSQMENDLPHILFLDLNMPRVNGWQCLQEIKRNEKLKHLQVVIFSTSFQEGVADQLYQSGAMHYIRKPSDFHQLQKVIHQVLAHVWENVYTGQELDINTPKLSFVLS